MAQSERRVSKRKLLDRLTYIDIAGGNGGVVTDVSEGGLGFRVIAPIEKAAAVRFVLSGHSTGIEGAGNVAWIDDSRKIGGLTFTEFPEEIREQVRNWPLLTQLPLEPFAGVRTPAGTRAPALHYGVPYTPEQAAVDDAATVDGAAAVDNGGSYYKQYFPDDDSQMDALGKRSQLLRVIGISSLAAVLAVLFYFTYRDAQKSPAHPTPAGPSQQSAATTPPASSNSSSQVAPPRNAAGKPDLGSATLPRGSAESRAAGEPTPSNAGRLAPQDTPVLHESEADESLILVVQVAAVAQQADAYQILSALQQKHFSAFISPPVNDTLYRVQLGPYQTPEDARASVTALEKAGYKPFIVISK